MIQNRSIQIAAITLGIAICFTVTISAQQQAATPDTNYDVTLQLVIGSNETGAKNDLPSNLNSVAQSIRSNFSFTSYRLSSTFVGRLANTGHFDYESVANIEGKELSPSVPTFLDWSLVDLEMIPGTHNLRAQSFKFGTRVPIYVGDASKGQQAVNYEHIGVSLVRVGLIQNTPTLIGTLHLPGQSGTIFLVMTVRPTDS
ncbi:MAG: hypothetical protein JO314_12380 [Acidobacteria bacterium]|nr:hypothetical protein [Acidobacteriota bacterium]